ncbi:AI-2E family transporter [Enterobacter soli]
MFWRICWKWPTVRLENIGCSRRWATSIVLVLFVGILLLMSFVVMPVAWQQGIYLIRDMPGMLNKLSDFAATLPRRYPALMDAGIIDAMAENMRARIMTMGGFRGEILPGVPGWSADAGGVSGAGSVNGFLPGQR